MFLSNAKAPKNNKPSKIYKVKDEAKTDESLFYDDVPTQPDMDTPTQPVFNDIPIPSSYDSDAIFREMDNESLFGTSTHAINLTVGFAPDTQKNSETADAAASNSPIESDKKHKTRTRPSRRRFLTPPPSTPSTEPKPSSATSSSTHASKAASTSSVDQKDHTFVKKSTLTPMNSFSANSGRMFTEASSNLPTLNTNKNSRTKTNSLS